MLYTLRKLSLKSCCLVYAQHDVHVLDGGAGSALAQVVKEGSDSSLIFMSADHQLPVVGAGKFRRVGEDGALGKANAGQNAGVAPGFCL